MIYKDLAPKAVTSAPHEETNGESPPPKVDEPQHSLLLTRDAVPAVLSLFTLAPHEQDSMYRAIEQAKLRVANGKIDR